VAKLAGELGTVGMRLIDSITSAAVKSEPSCHLTPLRNLNSQVSSSSAFHDSASPGRSCSLASLVTSFSNT